LLHLFVVHSLLDNQLKLLAKNVIPASIQVEMLLKQHAKIVQKAMHYKEMQQNQAESVTRVLSGSTQMW
jgi:Lhr-like helicase